MVVELYRYMLKSFGGDHQRVRLCTSDAKPAKRETLKPLNPKNLNPESGGKNAKRKIIHNKT